MRMPFWRTRRLVVVLLLAICAPNLPTTSPFAVLTAAAAEPSAASACRPPGTTGWLDEGIPTDFNVFLRPAGTLKAIMVFVDFPDAPIGEASLGWQRLWPDLELHRAGAAWLNSASYGDVRVAITPSERWYRMSQPSWAYGMDRAATFDQHVTYLAEAVALADPDVDFSAYDLVYVVAGPNAFGISRSNAYIDRSDSRVRADGVAIGHAATFGTSVWTWRPADRPLVLAHETAHLFGLPDLYASSGRSASVRGRLGCDGRPGSGGPRPTGLAPLEVGLDRKRTGRLLEQAGGVRRAPASGRPPAWYEARRHSDRADDRVRD